MPHSIDVKLTAPGTEKKEQVVVLIMILWQMLEEEDALRGENHAINSKYQRCAAKSRIAAMTIFPSSIAMKRKRVRKAESATEVWNRTTGPMAIDWIPQNDHSVLLVVATRSVILEKKSTEDDSNKLHLLLLMQ
jgi:hypothetical protein